MITVVKVLELAKSYIEKGWCQEAQAKESRNRVVYPESSEACCWCPSGACYRAENDLKKAANQLFNFNSDVADAAISYLNSEVDPVLGLELWNDSKERTKEEVLELFDKTIKKVKELILSNDELLRLAERHKPPQDWFNEDCPF